MVNNGERGIKREKETHTHTDRGVRETEIENPE
jgi:hypothetical protein